MPALLEVRGLIVRYGRRDAVRDLDLTVEPGEIVGLLGPNGAGKSTTLLAVAGGVSPAAGTILVGGRDVAAGELATKAAVGLADQPPSLYEFLTAREHLRFVAEARAGRADAVDDLCERLGLTPFADRPCRELSYGMRQRVGLAAAVVAGARLLLLDETLNGLDPDATRRGVAVIQDAARAGAGVLISTHLMALAARMCQRVVVLDHGRLVAARAAPFDGEALEQLYLDHVGADPAPAASAPRA
ncbi:MAG: ABC transporter ATP-binding protein [Kofleriaceae bacterium]|nr:ABC transporter ATP-binding protein [Kofleriaceae bacterium]